MFLVYALPNVLILVFTFIFNCMSSFDSKGSFDPFDPFALPIVEDLTEEQQKRRKFLISELYLGYRTFNLANYGQRLYDEVLSRATLAQLELEYKVVPWIKRR